MLLQSQELANLGNNNTSSNVNLKSPDIVNISKKFTEEKSKNDSYSLADFQVIFALNRMKLWNRKLKILKEDSPLNLNNLLCIRVV